MSTIQDTLAALLKDQSVLLDVNLNPLYILPVVAVIVSCLLVYAFGFKSSPNTLPPSSLALLRDSKPKPKNKTTKPNGNAKKPQAVVKPLKQEVRTEVVVMDAVKKPKAVIEEEVDDLDSGDWVTVVSDKTKKNLKKEQRTEVPEPTSEPKKKAKEVQKKSQVISKNANLAILDAVPDGPPITIRLEDWKAQLEVEDPIVSGKESRVGKKAVTANNKNKKVQEKLMERQLSREEKALETVSDNVPVGKQDKITKDILAQYDAPPAKKETKKEAPKKKEKKSAEPAPPAPEAAKKQEPKKPKETAKKETAKKETSVPKTDTSSSPAKTAAKKKENKGNKPAPPAPVVEAPVVAEPPAPPKATGSTDVTDGENMVVIELTY